LWTFHLYVALKYGVYTSHVIWYSRACGWGNGDRKLWQRHTEHIRGHL
jgi:hypothetical protein